jgi:hypothetical protein
LVAIDAPVECPPFVARIVQKQILLAKETGRGYPTAARLPWCGDGLFVYVITAVWSLRLC